MVENDNQSTSGITSLFQGDASHSRTSPVYFRATRHRSITGHHRSITGRHQSISGRHQSIPGRHRSITGRRRSVTGRHQSIPGRHQSITGRHQTVSRCEQPIFLRRHQSVPRRHQSITGRQQSVPRCQQSIPGLKQSLLGVSWNTRNPEFRWNSGGIFQSLFFFILVISFILRIFPKTLRRLSESLFLFFIEI